MRILLTNDDGIRAPGIAALHAELTPFADVFTVAPLHAQSASSHAMTFEQPVFCYEVTVSESLRGFGVEGYPADCVKLALTRLCDEHFGGAPDLIVSGMNAGSNAGMNTVYSGTVAAALEGALSGIPSIAVSLLLDDWKKARFDVAARHGSLALRRCLQARTLEVGEMLNINIPATEKEGECPPLRVCSQNLGPHKPQYERRHSPRGNPYFWATGGGLDFQFVTEGSDVEALNRGEIAVTPLQFDYTRHQHLARWQESLGHPE